jgi:hypothetical protein
MRLLDFRYEGWLLSADCYMLSAVLLLLSIFRYIHDLMFEDE